MLLLHLYVHHHSLKSVSKAIGWRMFRYTSLPIPAYAFFSLASRSSKISIPFTALIASSHTLNNR